MAPKRLAAYLDLSRSRVLIAGGGAVAAQKMRALPKGCELRLVSPELSRAAKAALKRLGGAWLRRKARASDVAWADLIFAATSSKEANQSLALAARRERRFCCVVDAPAQGSLILPAVARAGGIEISVSTGGRSPAIAKALRVWLEAKLKKPALRKALGGLGRARAQLKRDPRAKDKALQVIRNARAFARLLK